MDGQIEGKKSISYAGVLELDLGSNLYSSVSEMLVFRQIAADIADSLSDFLFSDEVRTGPTLSKGNNTQREVAVYIRDTEHMQVHPLPCFS